MVYPALGNPRTEAYSIYMLVEPFKYRLQNKNRYSRIKDKIRQLTGPRAFLHFRFPVSQNVKKNMFRKIFFDKQMIKNFQNELLYKKNEYPALRNVSKEYLISWNQRARSSSKHCLQEKWSNRKNIKFNSWPDREVFLLMNFRIYRVTMINV